MRQNVHGEQSHAMVRSPRLQEHAPIDIVAPIESIYQLPVEPPRVALRSLAIRQSKLAEVADELPTIVDSPLVRSL
jgi:hypothetical protein